MGAVVSGETRTNFRLFRWQKLIDCNNWLENYPKFGGLWCTSWPARRCPGIRAPRWPLLELSRFAITQPRDELFTNEKDCFSKCVGFDQKVILNRKECPVDHHWHYTESSILAPVFFFPAVVKAWLKWISASLLLAPVWYRLYFAGFFLPFWSIFRCVARVSP